MIGIYKITNLINQKSYIGQSVNIESRWRHHKADAFNLNSDTFNKYLYKAFRKYGLENFNFLIIEECPMNMLDIREKYWILYYNSYLKGYNQTRGSQTEELKELHKLSFLSKEIVDEIKLKLKTDLSSSTEEIGSFFNISGRTVRDINTGKTWFDENLKYPIRKPYASLTTNYLKLQLKNYCIDCGKEISKTATRCVECNHKLQYKTEHPDRETLKKLIRINSFVSIGKDYNVSDNAVRKWCKQYNLPYSKKIIKQYSNEEWKDI